MIKGVKNIKTNKVHILNLDNKYTLCSISLASFPNTVEEVDISKITCKRCIMKHNMYK